MASPEHAPARASALKLQIALALGIVYVVWGSTYLAIRFAVETIPPLTMAGVRFLLAGSLLYVWSRWRGAERPRLVHWRSGLVSGALLLVLGNGIVVWAEQWVDSGLTALLVSTTPLWIVLLHWWRQDGGRPGPRVWAGIALGFLGVGLLVNPSGAGGVSLAWAALLVTASFCWAAGSLYLRRAETPASPFLTTSLEMLCGGGLLLVLGLASGEAGKLDLAAMSTRSLLGFAYLVVFGALVAFTAYSWLLKAAPPALVSTYAYINPLVAVLLGWAFAGEVVTSRTLLAALIIVSGVALLSIPRKEPRAASAPELAGVTRPGERLPDRVPAGVPAPRAKEPAPRAKKPARREEVEIEEEILAS